MCRASGIDQSGSLRSDSNPSTSRKNPSVAGASAARVPRNPIRRTRTRRTLFARVSAADDACWTSPTTRIDEVFGYQLAGTCETLFPTFGDTRTAAGGGLSGDTLKCQLKPLDFASYPVTFTAAQQRRVQNAFPTGVCDWSKPG